MHIIIIKYIEIFEFTRIRNRLSGSRLHAMARSKKTKEEWVEDRDEDGTEDSSDEV